MLAVSVDPRQLEMDELRLRLVEAYDASTGYNPDLAGQCTRRMRELLMDMRASEKNINIEEMKALYLQGMGSKAIARKMFVSRDLVLEHIKNWRLNENLRPSTLFVPPSKKTLNRFMRDDTVDAMKRTPMYKPKSKYVTVMTADMVAAAIVTACKYVSNADPIELAQGKISHKKKEWWWAVARGMAFEALHTVVPHHPKMSIARMVGVRGSSVNVYGTNWERRRNLPGYSAEGVAATVEAVRKAMPS